MKRSIFVLLIALALGFVNGTALAVDIHFDGSTDSNWNVPDNWDTGIPTTSDNAYIDLSADAQIVNYSAEADRLFVDNGNTLTIGSGGQLDLSETSYPAFWVGDTGDADFVLDGGLLYHGATFGGDFKCGSAEGSTVNIEVKSGTWETRAVRLGEAQPDGPEVSQNWPPAEKVVSSTVNFLQSGGTIDLEVVRPTNGRIYLPYSSGATATFTMNGGSLKTSFLHMCYGGLDSAPSFGTFNLNSGTVEVLDELVVGRHNTASIGSIADFNQTGGTVSASEVLIAKGYKQGIYTISGGALTATTILRNGWDNFDGGGVGKFKVIGTDPNSINVGQYRQNGLSKLVAEIDSDGVATSGITPIAVATDAIFWSNSMLDVSLAPGVSVGGPTDYTLMTTGTGIIDNGIKVVGDSCQHVTYQIAGNNLIVTYHPTADPGRCDEEAQICLNPLDEYDLDGSCIVDFGDISLLAGNWLVENLEPW